MPRGVRIALIACAFILSGTILSSQVHISSLVGLLFQLDVRAIASSLALLGYGLGGVVAAHLFSKKSHIAGIYILEFVLLAAVLLYLTFFLLIHASDLHLLSTPGFVIISLLSFAYYCVAGTVVACLTFSDRENVHYVYAADLIGAAVCTAIVVYVADRIGLFAFTPFFIVFLCAVALLALFIAPVSRGRLALVLLGVTMLLSLSPVLHKPVSCGYKGSPALSQRVQEVGARSNSFSFVQMYVTDESPARAGVALRINCAVNSYGYKTNNVADVRSDLNTFRNIPFALRPYAETLIIGSGSGVDVIRALDSGGVRVVAVEINPLIPSLLDEYRHDLRTYPYHDPRVNLLLGDARNYVEGTDKKFNLVLLAQSKNFGHPWGAHLFVAKSLYTEEAFAAYTRVLAPAGVIAIYDYSWLTRQYIATLAHLNQSGDSFADHLIIISEGSDDPSEWVLYKPSAFTMAERAAASKIATSFGAHVSRFTGGEEIHGVLPLSDNRPFLIGYDSTFESGQRSKSVYPFRFIPNKRGLLHMSAVVVVLIVALLGVVYWARRSARTKKNALAIAYLTLLASGTSVVQFLLIYQTTLLLRNPAYAQAVVLALFLLSGGMGSIVAYRIGKRVSIGLLSLLMVAYLVFDIYAIQIYRLGFGSDIVTRSLITLAIVAFPGFISGVLFPLIIRQNSDDTSFAARLWSVDCLFFTSIGFASAVIAVMYGFIAVALLGLFAYLCGVYVAYRLAED